MRKFVKILSIDAEEMNLGTALKEGLVTMPKDTKPEDYDAEWPGYHTVLSKAVRMDGTVEKEESWLPEEDFSTEWPREMFDDEFGWSSMAALSMSPGTKIYAEFHENQIRYQRALAAARQINPDEMSEDGQYRMLDIAEKHASILKELCLSYVRQALANNVYLNIENDLAGELSKETLDKIESFKAKIEKK